MRRLLLFTSLIFTITFLNAKLTIIEKSETEFLLEFKLEPWELVAEGNYSRIVAENMDYNNNTGAPLIPYDEFKVGIPPSGNINYSLLNSNTTSITLPSKLLPVPEIKKVDGISSYEYKISPEEYQLSRTEFITELPVSNFRGYNFIPFIIYPFAYDGNKTLTLTTQASIIINISGQTNFRSLEPSDKAADVFLAQLINEQQTRNWRNNPRPAIHYAPFANSDWWVRIETNREGMYRINRSDLSGLPLNDIDPTTIRIFTTTGKVLGNNIDDIGAEFKEIPIIISGEADHKFDPEDYILFYGSSRDGYEMNANVQDNQYYNPYSQNQVFWLSFGGSFNGNPIRIQTITPPSSYDVSVTSTPAVKHIENEIYRREETGFDWYSQTLFGNSTAEYNFTTDLTDIDLSGEQIVQLRLRQEDTGEGTNHRIQVYVNGWPIIYSSDPDVYDFTWSGTWPFTIKRNTTHLRNGSNTITIKVSRTTTDNLYLDYIHLAYQQNLNKSNIQKQFSHTTSLYPIPCKFNLSGDLSNILVFRSNGIYSVDKIPLTDSYFISEGTSSTSYFILKLNETYNPALIRVMHPTDLTANISQVDNIIVSPSEFISHAQVLADKYWDYYQVRSKVILVDDIYNQFNGGHIDPAAIRLALKYFYSNFTAPRISSLTLLGLGTIDWRNFSGSAATKNKMIVWQNGFLTSDDYFGMINTDYYPEIAIGRYPVKNTAEMNIMLQNFSNYTSNPSHGWWRNSMIFLADDLTNGPSNYEYIHTQDIEDIGSVLNPSILADKIFAMEYEYDEFQNKPRARDDMFKAINEGRLVFLYAGHGSFDKLGAEDYLNGATDMGRFANPDKLTLFIAASCDVSQFDYWGFESLGQKVVLMNNLGAIASYAATRKSYAENNRPMMKYLMESLADNRNPLGYSIMDAKIRYTGSNSNDAVYVLLGDPLIRVIPPERDSTMQVNLLEDNVVLHSRETAIINGSFSTPGLSGEAEVRIFDPIRKYSLGPNTNVSKKGNQLFRGRSEVTASQYNSAFIVPDDIISGNKGLCVSYIWDEATKKDYTNYYFPLGFSDQAVDVDNPDTPQINIYLGHKDFRPGDTVGTNTTLYADFYDSNGINITGSSGHNILLVIDNSLQPLAITDYFNYDRNSCTNGNITYPLSNLSEGIHTIQVIAFDNFNMPAVATTHFVAKKQTELDIEQLLIYPNPLSKDAYITFILTSDAQVNIGIYTLRGKRIHNLKVYGKQGFNKIYFSGKDDQGDTLSNNTYFLKVQATSADGKKVEKTEKMVIYK